MDAFLLVVVLVGIVAVSLWAGVDALLQPDMAYREAGISKLLTTSVIVIGCAAGAVFYVVVLRPRLKRVQQQWRA